MGRKKRERAKDNLLKVYFPDEESRQELIDLAAEYGVPISKMAVLLIEHGKEAISKGELDVQEYLREHDFDWLYEYDLDIEKKRRKRGK